MRKIFLDLEMNAIAGEHKDARKICWQETIEFGAVCLNESNQESDSFRCYVKPEYNDRITSNITKITGIHTEQVQDAETFEKVFNRFVSWCGYDFEIYSWSDSDLIQLKKEMILKGIPETESTENLFRSWKDLQKEYDDFLFCERQIGLKTAVDNAGLEFRGTAHSALGDARATADLYREMKDGSTLMKINKMLGDGRKPLGTSLGDVLGNITLATA